VSELLQAIHGHCCDDVPDRRPLDGEWQPRHATMMMHDNDDILLHLFTAVLRIRPKDEDAQRVRIVAHLHLGDYVAALAALSASPAASESMAFEKVKRMAGETTPPFLRQS
jgi:hypothetical protein